MVDKAVVLGFENCLVNGFFCDVVAETREDFGLPSDKIKSIIFGEEDVVDKKTRDAVINIFSDKIMNAEPVEGVLDSLDFLKKVT